MVGLAAPAVESGGAPPVGVLMLDTDFQRFPGDIGHAESLPFPAIHQRVSLARVPDVVTADALSPEVLAAFVAVGQELVDQGAGLITTSCGFLHVAQSALSQALPVPVVTSSLVALPGLQKSLGPRADIGVLTFDERCLSAQHLGKPAQMPLVVGIDPVSHFADVIHERAPVNPAQLRLDVEHAADALAQQSPAAVILECTNLGPWRSEVERVCGVPVIDLIDVLLARLNAYPAD